MEAQLRRSVSYHPVLPTIAWQANNDVIGDIFSAALRIFPLPYKPIK